MASHICIINAHPDPSQARFIHALCDAYEAGAHKGGHTVERIDIGTLDYDFLTRATDFGDFVPAVFSRQSARPLVCRASSVTTGATGTTANGS